MAIKFKKILIIAPKFPPSNLAGVHRSRLFAQHLPDFGWEPIILTVHENFYEETLDHNLTNLLRKGLRVEKVNAFKITKPKIIGDIGLRAFIPLYNRAKEIIVNEKVDFLYIPIPSFYVALLGRMLHHSTGVLYGIDYIDPWVHKFPGSDKIFSRHWFSTHLAKILEPIAVKKASLITGVAEGYYQGVMDRNKSLVNYAKFGSMPYGGEVTDHKSVKDSKLEPYLFKKKEGVINLMYAGAMLPKAYKPLEAVMASIKNNYSEFQNINFHFIGTGISSRTTDSYLIKPMAEKYGLWNTVIFEYPKRIPYLDVLFHLEASDGVFILGSTEPHYTPSKVYQAVLAEKPILAVLHTKSTAVKVIESSNVGVVLAFDGESDMNRIESKFANKTIDYIKFLKNFKPENIVANAFEKYSAKSVTKILVQLINSIIK